MNIIISMTIDHNHNQVKDDDQDDEGATCILPTTPVESILDATLTAFPQMSYWGFFAPVDMFKH